MDHNIRKGIKKLCKKTVSFPVYHFVWGHLRVFQDVRCKRLKGPKILGPTIIIFEVNRLFLQCLPLCLGLSLLHYNQAAKKRDHKKCITTQSTFQHTQLSTIRLQCGLGIRSPRLRVAIFARFWLPINLFSLFWLATYPWIKRHWFKSWSS